MRDVECSVGMSRYVNLSTSKMLMEIDQNILLRLLLKTRSTVVKRVQDTVADNQAKPSHVALHFLFSCKKNCCSMHSIVIIDNFSIDS